MRQVKTPAMDNSADPAFSADLTAAFSWWRDAGVDCDFHDEPQSWLVAPEVAASKDQRPRTGGDLGPQGENFSPAERAPTPLGDAGVQTPDLAPGPMIDRSALPQDLAAFAAWWLTEPSLAGGRVTGRVPPRGATGAKLMVLVPHPERDDAEHLLSGPQGRLLDAMLAAMGLTAEETYLAAALPRHTPHADWAGIAAQGMGAVLARHIALARPERLLVFGGAILPLLSNDPTKNPTDLSQFNLETGTIPLLLDRHLAVLLERPGWKARFWTRWLDWSE